MQPPLPQPVFLNVEYVFFLVYRVFARIFNYIFSEQFLITLQAFATILVILFITAVIYLLVRMYEIAQEDKAQEKKSVDEKISNTNLAASAAAVEASKENPTWNHVRERLLSDVESDWRLAIIEADIYLDRLLDSRGYYGETFSDKLKQLTPETLPSIQFIWEAHKVRNRIAHDGAAFILTQPEARRVLSYYEIAFRDLGVIA